MLGASSLLMPRRRAPGGRGAAAKERPFSARLTDRSVASRGRTVRRPRRTERPSRRGTPAVPTRPADQAPGQMSRSDRQTDQEGRAAMAVTLSAEGRPDRAPRRETPVSACWPWRWTCSTSAATTAPRWRTWPRRPGSPSPRSTTTWPARRSCSGSPSRGRWTGCSPGWPRRAPRGRPWTAWTGRPAHLPGAGRPAALRHPAAAGPRQHGHRARGAGAAARVRPPRRGTGRRRRGGWRAAADLDPRLTARLIFGLVNSVIEWYRPHTAGGPALTGPELADTVAALVFDGLRAR